MTDDDKQQEAREWGATGSELVWHEPTEAPPEGVYVFAEYHPYNDKRIGIAEHLVWFYGGEWRIYPSLTETAYVRRWRFMTQPHLSNGFDRAEARHADQLDSKDAAIAELVKAGIDLLSHLNAARSLLATVPKAGKKGAPSDKMFDQMVNDYAACVVRNRPLIAKHKHKENVDG